MITVQTVKFVSASEIFAGKPYLCNEFFENIPFTFGDNNYSLISKERFVEALDELDTEHSTEDSINEIKSRIESFPENTYIDLES